MDDVRNVGNLADAVAGYDFAYLLTVGDDGRPHAVAVNPRLEDGLLMLPGAGSKSLRNLGARPDVSLVWAPGGIEQYSLIVDGSATAGPGERVEITPTRAVLHRPGVPADAGEAGGCVSDCRELALSA